MWKKLYLATALTAVFTLGACATVAGLMQVQAPNFTVAEGQVSELRLLGPGAGRPLGGVAIRIWSRVENPNAFGLTLTSLQGDLHLEDARAAAIDLPLGLPLRAGQDTVIPIEVAVSFADLPGLADAVMKFATQRTVGYRMDGRFAVDAGPLGRPNFGPMTLVRGDLDVRR
jgi:hypothetical protein